MLVILTMFRLGKKALEIEYHNQCLNSEKHLTLSLLSLIAFLSCCLISTVMRLFTCKGLLCLAGIDEAKLKCIKAKKERIPEYSIFIFSLFVISLCLKMNIYKLKQDQIFCDDALIFLFGIITCISVLLEICLKWQFSFKMKLKLKQDDQKAISDCFAVI